MVLALKKKDKIMLQLMQGILRELDLPQTDDIQEGRRMVLRKLEHEGTKDQIEALCDIVVGKLASRSSYRS